MGLRRRKGGGHTEPTSNPLSSCPAPHSRQDEALPPLTSPNSQELRGHLWCCKNHPEQLPRVPHHQMHPWASCAPKPAAPHRQLCPTTRFPPTPDVPRPWPRRPPGPRTAPPAPFLPRRQTSEISQPN